MSWGATLGLECPPLPIRPSRWMGETLPCFEGRDQGYRHGDLLSLVKLVLSQLRSWLEQCIHMHPPVHVAHMSSIWPIWGPLGLWVSLREWITLQMIWGRRETRGKDQSRHGGDQGAYSPAPEGLCLVGVKPGRMKGSLGQSITGEKVGSLEE